MNPMVRRLVLALVLLSAGLPAQWSFQADLPSRFIWRGFDLYPEDNPAFQPSATYAFGGSGFSINFWGSAALSGRDELGEWDEVDLTLTYAFAPSEGIDAAAGFTHYGWYWADDFSFEDATTQEAFVSVRFTQVRLAPAVTLYYDFNLASGLYVSMDAGRAFRISETAELAVAVAAGYNRHFQIEGEGWSDVTLSAAVPFSLGKVKLTPFAKYSRILMEEVNPAEYEAWGGVSVGF